MMLIGICDDTLEMRQRYKELFQNFIDDEKIDAELVTYKSGDQVIFNVEDVIENVDILFMDIKMPGLTGLETSQKLRELGYTGVIVFLTRSKDNVFDAFDVNAFHYIVKDMATEKRVKEIFLKAIKDAKEKKSEYMILSGVGEYRSIPIDKIHYFEIMQKIVTVYYEDKSFEFISTIGKLENQLFNKGFMRIGRSYLVSLHYIEAFSYERVTMRDGTVLPVGRKYYKDLKAAMQG